MILASLLGLGFILALTSPAVAGMTFVSPLAPVEETDGRAGTCYSFYYDPPEGPDRPFVQKALDAGSRWDRFDFIWPNLEPANDAWDTDVLEAYDAVVDSLASEDVNMVGILLWTPDWAATKSGGGFGAQSFDRRPFGWYAPVPHGSLASRAVSASSSPPQGLYLPWNDPNNHWGDFVYDIVTHYKGQVKHWEMWNEPEWDYFWTGTSTDYAQLLKVGYRATKAACPDCTVLFGGLHYWANPSYYRWVLSALDDDPAAPSNNYFFDVMSVHLYSRSSNTYDEVNNIKSGMTTYNVGDHPIWLTETGVPVWNDDSADPDPTKYDYAATQDEAAAYVIQSYANAWASDVERYFLFRTHDADMSEYFGLIRNDHSLRPAYVAYQVAATYLISPTFTTRASAGSHLRVTLWGTPHGKVSVLWNESADAGDYVLPAAIETATLVDRLGVTQTVDASGGAYTFTLPGATANLVSNPGDYIIGGDPLIVIESEMPNEPPTSTVYSLPEITHTPIFTVTWEGQDNESGVWLYDVQVRDGSGGQWVSWQQSTAATSGQFTGQHGHIYYFRSRATDHVGNRENWPAEYQAYTTLDLSSKLHLSVGAFFADENSDGEWSRPITATGEVTLTQVTLRLLDEVDHDVVTPIVGSAGEFTTTIYAGQTYQLWATSSELEVDHVYILSLTWPRGGEVYTNAYETLGLWPVSQVYLPLVVRDGG
jgi:hypothetical protein